MEHAAPAPIAALHDEDEQDAAAFRLLLELQGFTDVRRLGRDRWVAIRPILHTGVILTGRMFDEVSITERWRYEDGPAARAALEAWDGTGEPQGWYRHVPSGRHRPGGDAEREEVRD